MSDENIQTYQHNIIVFETFQTKRQIAIANTNDDFYDVVNYDDVKHEKMIWKHTFPNIKLYAKYCQLVCTQTKQHQLFT